jgi:hypothetical protein
MASNMERFDQLTGAVFARLYEAFPEPISLDAFPFLSNIVPSDQDEGTQYEQAFGAPEFFVYTVRWLAETGYLTHRKQSENIPLTFEDCVLTAKGLEVLKSVPASISTSNSIGQSLQEAAKTGSLDAIKKLAGEALSTGVHLAVGIARAHLPS